MNTITGEEKKGENSMNMEREMICVGTRVFTLKAKDEAMVMDYVPAGAVGEFMGTERIGDTVVLRLRMDKLLRGPDGVTNVLEFYLDDEEDVADYIEAAPASGTLDFLGRQMTTLIREVGQMRDEVNVLTAIMRRLVRELEDR